jgi:ribosome maturation factor RimP
MTGTKHRRSPSSSKGRGRRPAEISAAVGPVAERIAVAHGFVLWAVTFLRDAGRETLRVAVDRRGGIGADDLAVFSDELSRELDRIDPVPGEKQYILEVTSPGAERQLESLDQFDVCVGRVAKLHMTDGRTIEGPIAGISDRSVDIGSAEETVRVLFDDISRAQLVVKF